MSSAIEENAWTERVEPNRQQLDVATSSEMLLAALRELLGEFTPNVHHQLEQALICEQPIQQIVRAWRAWESRVSSSVMVGATPEKLRAEFARQTAYVFIIRLLLVRICEDKGLFARKQNDSVRYLDYASGRSYEYLTPMAHECAQNVHAHFYGAADVFDWYRIDDNILRRALVVLEAFNLEKIDTDLIGTVYGRYLQEGKHERGRYYTAPTLVRTMLDQVGYVRGAIADRRIADIACGSGSFLVEACRRLLDSFREADGQIPTSRIETALEQVRHSMIGIDLNPFACYLAETNLLIQVLDLIRQAKDAGQNVVVQRFSIHCADALLVSKDLAPLLFPPHAVDAELIKARQGEFENGFDFLVGNPPYVRHDENENIVSYLGRIEEESWFETKHMKWDLYVPFVEQNLRLLADSPNARCCLVTIESLGTAPYASKLRVKLTEQATVHRVLFTEKLQLFPDAKWQDNIVFTFSRGRPPAQHIVQRQIARRFANDDSIVIEALDQLTRDDLTADRVFNRRDQVTLDLSKTVRLEELCYVSKGMVLHANERLAKNETITVSNVYEPARFGEEIVEDLGSRGKRIRHKPFIRDDLVADHRDDLHSRPYLGSREVRRGGFGPIRWIEFGAAARCPSRVDRPTFPELFERPKVLFGEFTGIAVDSGGHDGFIIVSHSVNIAVRWCLLADVTNRSLTKAKKALGNRLDASRSSNLSEWYLCALTQSEPIQRFLQANKRSMKEHVYPEDIKAIPIKLLTPKQQRPFIDRAKRRHRLWDEITALESRGFDKKARQVTQLHEQIETINAELDRLAWRLYRPRKDKAAREDD